MDNPPDDYEQHHAWLESLSPDELLVVHVPTGYQVMFIVIALTKRALLAEGIKPGERLGLLERLMALTDQYLTTEMLAAIEPLDDIGAKIVAEAQSLNRPDDKLGGASFAVLTSPRVFWHLTERNPSFLAAIKIRGARMKENTAASAALAAPRQ